MKELTTNIGTIVILGAWNKAILSEKWVHDNILKDYSGNLSVEYPINTIGSLKFNLDDFSFYIIDNRLTVVMKKTENNSYQQVVKLIRSLVRLLPHTPVAAMGINFVFEEETMGDIFNELDDNAKLTDVLKHEISAQEIARRFKINEQHTINIKVVKDSQPSCKIDFNFNYKLKSILDIPDILGDNDDIIINKKKEALNIIDMAYGK